MLFPPSVEDIYAKISRNTQKGSSTFYAPLSPEESAIIRAEYLKQLRLPVEGDPRAEFFTLAGTHIATGYRGVVIGDYGAYIEFSPEQINHRAIEPRFPGEPSRPVKYIWMQSKDSARAKVYEQRAPVAYADYLAGMYYISPLELTGRAGELLSD